ncbi:7715_t:CDS:2, partial [Scutellospora calospora]
MTTTTSPPKNVKVLEGAKITLTTVSSEQTIYDDKNLVKSPLEMNFPAQKGDENAKDEKQKSNLDRRVTLDKKLSTAVTDVMNVDDAKVSTKIENGGELVIMSDLNMSDITKSAVFLAEYKILKYGETNAELELHLKAMSAVVHIASRSISMLEQETRERLYKSVARFWDASQRTSAKINPNITFYLREIRCCLKKIKDDQTKMEFGLLFVRNLADAAVHAAIKNYFAAAACAVKSFSFEYPAGEWYEKWRVILEEFIQLKQTYEGYPEFWKKLYNIAREEFKYIREKRASIAVKNAKYKVLKRGSEIFFCSLPDNVDTLLIGYLILMERLIKEFPQYFEPDNNYSIEILEFCQEIVNSDIKKQLSAKAIEIILIIQDQIDVMQGSK